MMRTQNAEVVVLGAGAMGSAAAYHLARRGQGFTLVEQFGLGHDRGSSHGAARIARHSYADPAYARLMVDAFDAWRTLEADAALPLSIRAGGLSISPRATGYVDAVAANLAAIGIAHRRFDGRELNRRLPAFRVADDLEVVYEPDAGLISAARAIRAQLDLAREFGGDRTVILEHQAVRHLDLDGPRPKLVFDDHAIEADRLVVAAGPWTSRLLPELAGRLRPTHQRVLYFRPEDRESFGLGRLPVFIFMGEDPMDAYYGMPECLGMGVKVARHGGPDVDPGRVDRATDPAYIDHIRGFLGRTIPALAAAPIDVEETCLYTMAEGERFSVGPLPGRPDVIVASPCSGHGFKFSCLIGRILADLAVDGRTEVGVDAWRLA